MDGHIPQSKLTRTNSSLLRSSPTIRSSIHSLSSVTEEDCVKAYQQEDDEEDKKTKPGSTQFTPVRTMVSLIFLTLFLFSFFFCFTLRKEDIPTSENLLLALIFVAITLYLANKNKKLINQILYIVKQLWKVNSSKFGLWGGDPKANAKQIQWFIGGSNPKKLRNGFGRTVREGVVIYSNGDFYEGEFHKGKCNGSGVYNYFVSGRYEGDWVDGKYDGYGIESWARGSRYRGQYRQGLRHGYGIYQFYTGDSYAGKWCNGQSHGVGIQTCNDGSCYFGEFKCGAKHGLGAYHFRNGDRYAGEYFGDKVHGFGVYHFANGHCYEGSWHEGRKQGYGMYTFRNGENQSGVWDCGVLKTRSSLTLGSVYQAVQAARRSAENAINFGGLEGQLNKAIVAANRAATAARVAAIKAVQYQMTRIFVTGISKTQLAILD